MSDAVDFALALERMDGVGRVTAGRLLHHFGTRSRLCDVPREQVLTRIRGVGNAEQLVQRLFDDTEMQPLLESAAERRMALDEKRVHLLAPPDQRWPRALDTLPTGHRPTLLYMFGSLDVLDRPRVALFARPPLDGNAFERAQSLVRHLLAANLAPGTGASHGFDVVVHKLATDRSAPAPSFMVAPCGLARIQKSVRPVVSAVAGSGGLCVSTFRMSHGPFDHDDHERALVQAALADACVFVAPVAETAEARALAWALEAQRPVFDIGTPSGELPPQVPQLADTNDFEAVIDAARS